MNRILTSLALCLIALPAWAQVGPSIGGGGPGGLPNYSGAQGAGSGLPARQRDDDEGGGGGKKEEKPAEPPAAIPGAIPDPDAAVIPADKVAAEMSPNDALFDAITRGDLAAAKDAVNRGAQLDAKNVLGQTPTDAAIDLSRNDITFLLLSLRGSVSSSRPTQQASAALRSQANGHVVKASAKHPTRAANPGDRGTPNAAVGFSGF
jgi:hypothetical protein